MNEVKKIPKTFGQGLCFFLFLINKNILQVVKMSQKIEKQVQPEQLSQHDDDYEHDPRNDPRKHQVVTSPSGESDQDYSESDSEDEVRPKVNVRMRDIKGFEEKEMAYKTKEESVKQKRIENLAKAREARKRKAEEKKVQLSKLAELENQTKESIRDRRIKAKALKSIRERELEEKIAALEEQLATTGIKKEKKNRIERYPSPQRDHREHREPREPRETFRHDYHRVPTIAYQEFEF